MSPNGDELVPFNLTIPQSDGAPLDLSVSAGDILFVLGANGTGKSSVMHRFYGPHQGTARRISAHRQTWFTSDAISMSPEQKRNTASMIQGNDTNPQARWRDDYSAQRTSISIYDLLDAEHVRNRGIALAADSGDMELVQVLAKTAAPIKVINELLRLSNIPIEISVKGNEQFVASKSGGPPYGIAELSDGERNALLIAADVLTVSPSTLVLIDEPERHLHRSIISPLLTQLFDKRSDCAFIVSTHEVMLPFDNPRARSLLVRNCTFSGSSFTAWDADLLPPETEIEAELKKDILGARRKLLFVEGTEGSLDKALYSLVFPNVSVVPKSGCRNVEHAVFSIRDTDGLHWLHAFGIVDNDRRTQAEIDRLKLKGVYVVSVFSVESIYYHPEIQRRVVERSAIVTGDDPTALLDSAKVAAVGAITNNVKRLSERAVEKALREKMFEYLPRSKDIAAATPIDVRIDVAAAVAAECSRLQDAINAGDLTAIIAQYPIRETPTLKEIAHRLGFRDRRQYEAAVRKLLVDDETALEFVRALFGTLEHDIATT
jgi:ABC-type lipoprotein export system ATPase subunit